MPVLSGQEIVDRIRVRLGSLSNAFSVEELLSFAEEGTQEVWGVLKSFDQEYFGVPSQDNDTSSTEDFFADLSTTKREYDLPPGCRELRGIEVLTPGYESLTFGYRTFDNPEFVAIRKNSTASGAGSGPYFNDFLYPNKEYLYAVFGNQMVLAQYPETALNIRLWYIKGLGFLSVNTRLSDILYPFAGKIVDFAVQKAMISTREIPMTEEWLKSWKGSVLYLAEVSSPRSSTGPQFIIDYVGE